MKTILIFDVAIKALVVVDATIQENGNAIYKNRLYWKCGPIGKQRFESKYNNMKKIDSDLYIPAESTNRVSGGFNSHPWL